MKNKKVFLVIQRFTTKERNRCRKFILSPYFNKNEAIIHLFNFVADKAEKEFSDKIEDESIWLELEPKKPFNAVRLRKYFSDLLKLIERFIAQEEYESKPIQKATLLLQGISGEKFKNLHSSSIKTALKLSSEQKEESIDGYFYNYQIERHISALSQNHDVFRELNLGNTSMNLDIFYLIEKLKLYCHLLTVKFSKNTEEDILLIKPIIKHIESHDFTRVPQLNIYHQIFNSIKEKDNTQYYFKLKDLLKEHGGRFNKAEAGDMYNFAINYIVYKINSGHENFLAEYFSLYEDLLNKEIIFENNELPTKHFFNVITIALRLKKFDWVSNFIETYSQYINEKEKENAVTYTLAQLHLYKKDFNKVLELLRFVEYKELSRKLNSKVMLINTYVELKEIEPLYSLLDSFRTFLGRNTQINKEKQTSFLILIKFVRRYISIQSTEIQKFKELKLKIEESESFVNKSWLLEKINSSINN